MKLQSQLPIFAEKPLAARNGRNAHFSLLELRSSHQL